MVKMLSTNITTLDLALGGGLPLGQISNFVGDSSSGKTFLACECIFAAKTILKDKLEWFYDDVENRFSFDTKKLYGFDIVKKDQVNSLTIEDFSNNLKSRLAKLKEGKTLIYVLDSFDALSSEAEIKRDEKEKESGTYNLEKVKAIGQFFRLRKGDIKESNCILIIISQVRENIGVMFGARYYRTGGKALDHSATVIMWLAEVEKHKKKHLAYGISTKCKLTKVGVDKPFRECIINVIFDRGVDDVAGNILYLYDLYTERGQRKEKLEKEIIEWEGKEYSFRELIQHIENNNLEDVLAQKVIDKWNEIEDSISSRNRKARW
jgi:recombination protein RecA